MNNIVIDSSAWIEYFQGSEKGKEIKKYIDEYQGKIYSSGIIVAEVCAKFLKDGSPNTEKAFYAIMSTSKLVNIDFNIGFDSSQIYVTYRKVKNKFGLIDSIILTMAKYLNAKVLTCDSDFIGIKEAIYVK